MVAHLDAMNSLLDEADKRKNEIHQMRRIFPDAVFLTDNRMKITKTVKKIREAIDENLDEMAQFSAHLQNTYVLVGQIVRDAGKCLFRTEKNHLQLKR